MNKIYRQLLATMLILTNLLIAGYIPCASAENSSDYEIQLLKGLGFVDKEYGPKSAEEPVTRGQIASILAYLRGFDKSTKIDGSFIDVPKDYWCAGQIYALCNAGILHGTAADRFSPNDYITRNQLVKMLVSALGYDMQAQMAGGYPQGYMSVGSELGLKSGSDVGAIDFGTAAKLFAEAMEVELLEMKIVDNKPVYEKVKDQNILKKYNDIYNDEGIMTDNGITKLNTPGTVGKNNVIINNMIMEKGSFDCDRYIGYNLKFYYKNVNGEKTLLYAYPYKTNVRTIADDDIDFYGSDFGIQKIYVMDDKKYCKIDEYVDVIYNGVAYPSFNADTFRIRQGELTLIDNDEDGTYDVVFADEYYNIYVTGKTDDIIYGKYGNSENIENADNLSIYDADGLPISTDEINSKNVMSVYKSKDSSNVKMIISSNTIDGKVDNVEKGVTRPDDMNAQSRESFINSMRDMRISVGEKSYSFSQSYIEAVADGYNGAVVPVYGITYTFCLDKNGKIAGVEETAGNIYAYLTKVCFVDDGSEMNDMTMAKMFMSDSTHVTTVFAENAKVDGVRMKSHESGSGTVSSYHEFFDGDGKFIPQLVRVKLNSLGEISEVQTSNSVTTNSYGYNAKKFSLCYSGKTGYGGSTQRSFNQSYTLGSDVVIFNVPPAEDFDASEIEIINVNRLQEGVSYNIKLYDADPSWACKAAVVQAGSSNEWEQAVLVVESVEKTIDDDDNIINVVSGYINKTKATYIEDSEGIFPTELESGDIVRVVLSGQKVKRMQILASAKRDTTPFYNSLDGNDWSSYYGQIYAKSNTALTLSTDGGRSITALPFNGSGTLVYIYDKASKTASVGTINDLVMTSPIKDDGTIDLSGNDTMVYVYKRRGYARNIVVIK